MECRRRALAIVAGLGIVLANLTSGDARAADRRIPLELKRAVFDPLRETPVEPERLRLAREPDSGYFVVQFAAPLDAGSPALLRSLGAVPLHYVPEQAWLVRLPAGVKPRLMAHPGLRWVGAVQPAWKLSPDLGRATAAADAEQQATIELFPREADRQVGRRLGELGIEVLRSARVGDSHRFVVRAAVERLEQAARIEAVAWIEPAPHVTLRNDAATWVVQSFIDGETPVWDRGLHGEGEILGHIDGQLDIDSCYFSDPSDNTPGPAHRKVVAYRSSGGLGADEHGTHTAGIAAGDRSPIDGQFGGNGHAWAARISFGDAFDITGSASYPSNLYEFLTAAHDDGARVHTNSWGDDETAQYTTWSRDVDRFSYDFEESLVVFAVTNLDQLRSPENAKNSLAVGASLNGESANSFCSGGRGPTLDGRRKPDVYTPGCGIRSALADAPCTTLVDSGTSMAAPAAAGAGLLVRQYFREGWYPDGSPQAADAWIPSGALLKAVLVNSATDMTGIPGYPSDREGWGRLLLDDALYFAGDRRRLVLLADVRNAAGLSTGGSDGFSLRVEGAADPLEITLAFTEPPAALLAQSATVNDLDLELTSPTGVVYRGNVFDSGHSVPGGSADPRNNVETILLPSPELGDWLVTVRGTAVNQGHQGYALVATGQVTPGDGGSLRYLGHTVQDLAPWGNGDGVVDPGETVVLPLSLLNLRAGVATEVTATLTTVRPDLVRVTRDTASFPDIPASGIASSFEPHFRFTVPPDTPCGSVLPFELHAVHAGGSTDSAFEIAVGGPGLVLASTDTPIEMPAFSGTPTVSQIEVSDAVDVGDLNVELHISHEDIAEMVITLASPTGTTVTLHNGSGAGTTDLNTIYDAERTPDGPGTMSWFDGLPAQGIWKLSVKDQVIGGFPATPGGTIEGWSLHLDFAEGTVCRPLECIEAVPREVPVIYVETTDGGGLRFSWPPLRGATGYRVWRSATPDFAQEQALAETSETSVVQENGLLDPASWYYRVRATNSCNWEGP